MSEISEGPLAHDNPEADLLPDSRLTAIHTTKGSVWRGNMWWEPIFCANCGADGGLVPEVNMTFAFYLCSECEGKHGIPAGMLSVPEERFWATVNLEMLERYGRILPPEELQTIVDAGTTPLAALFRDGVPRRGA